VPCVDGIWLVVGIRVFPAVLVCFIDLALIFQESSHIYRYVTLQLSRLTQVLSLPYPHPQVLLVIVGVVRGVLVLDVGVVGDFSTLVTQFHK